MIELKNFIGSLLVMVIAVGIFLLLMEKEIPEQNKEILISFVSVIFGAVAASMHKITGSDSKVESGDSYKKEEETEG